MVVGIEATRGIQCFLELLDELDVEYRVGDPAKMRVQGTWQQKNDRRDAGLLLKLLSEDRFPEIWMFSSEQRDLRTCCATVTSGCGCAPECSARCRPSHSITPCDGALRACGLCRAYASTSWSSSWSRFCS